MGPTRLTHKTSLMLIKRIKLKYRVTKDPEDLTKIQKEIELVEEETNSLIESCQRAREEFRLYVTTTFWHIMKKRTEESLEDFIQEWNLEELLSS